MSAAGRATGLVVARELTEALRRKAIWVTAAVTLAATAALVILPSVLGSSADAKEIAVVGSVTDTFTDSLRHSAANAGMTIRVVDEPDAASARQAVEDDEIDAAVVFADQTSFIVEDAEGTLPAVLHQAIATDRTVTELSSLGLTDEQISTVTAAPSVAVDVIDSDRSGRIAAASVISIAVYLLLFLVTMQVANGVAIEKSNRVSEVLLAIVPARSLLFGKVIGVGLTALIPLAAGAIPVMVRLATSGGLPPSTGTAVLAGAAWFVLGAGFYLLAAGALGALVERQEDAGSAVGGLSVCLVGSYLVAQSAPDTTIGAVLAYLPFSAPMVEPARLALGVSSTAEVIGSLLVCGASVLAMTRFSALIYRRAVVRTGRRLHLRDVLRAAPVT